MRIHTICLPLIVLQTVSCSTTSDQFRPIIDKVSQDFKTHHVILFVGDAAAVAAPRDRIICRDMINRLAVILIDMAEIERNHDNRSLTLSTFQHPTATTLFVVLDDRLDFGYSRAILEKINRYSPIFTRPKTLIIASSAEEPLAGEYRDLLVYAFSRKFLDLTILSATMMHTYNPFNESFAVTRLTQRTQLFPYKLANLKGYRLRVPTIELPPYQTVLRDENDTVIGLSGITYQYCKLLSESLNFTLEFVSGVEESALTANFTLLFAMLDSGEIDMLTMPFNVRSIMYDYCDYLLLGRLFLDTNYVMLVPIISLSMIDVPLDVVVFVPLLLIIMFIYESLAKLLKFPMRHWRLSKIYQILLGRAVARSSPRKVTEKLVYLSLIVISIKYSVETVTKILDIQLLKGEVGFDTLQEIAQSRLPIYSVDFIIDHVYGDNDDETVQELKRKTFAIVDILRCIYEAVNNKSCMCITPHSAGVYASKQFINEDGTQNIKVARPSLYDDMAAFAYERISPFAARFDQMTQRIIESGITRASAQQYEIKPSDYEEREPTSENIFLLQICAILSVGYVVACAAFAAELICGTRKSAVGAG